MAYYVTPGSRIPLVLNNYEFKTSTLLFPADWRPTHIRWLLIDPDGDVVYWIDHAVDSIVQVDSGYEGVYHYTVWRIFENSGFMQIPALAKEGEWKLQAQFYDKFFGIKFHKDTKTLYTFTVKRESFLDDMNAPIYFIFLDMPFSINFSLFVALFLLLILLIVWLLIIKVLLVRRYEHARR